VIETWPFIAVMASAFLHAAWNAIVRSGADPGERMASAILASGTLGLAGLIWTGLPDPQSWPWLIAGVIVNTIGIRLAMAAYRVASYGLVYPVMRAGIPLLMLPVGALFLQEWPRLMGLVGVLLIASALVLLALAARAQGGREMKGLGFALLAAVCGCGYVAADAVGVRISGNIYGYAFLVAVGNAAAITAMMAVEGRNVAGALLRNPAPSYGIALISTTSFVLYIYAVADAPVALVAALRETSVLFAIVIARFALKEQIGPWHWLAGLCAVAGVAAIRLG
jgi:drug/metabolite transporter (DMT)-like permease